MYQYMKKQM